MTSRAGTGASFTVPFTLRRFVMAPHPSKSSAGANPSDFHAAPPRLFEISTPPPPGIATPQSGSPTATPGTNDRDRTHRPRRRHPGYDDAMLLPSRFLAPALLLLIGAAGCGRTSLYDDNGDCPDGALCLNDHDLAG